VVKGRKERGERRGGHEVDESEGVVKTAQYRGILKIGPKTTSGERQGSN